MTIVLPENYHAWNMLKDRGILCISREQAMREDIRALRIGILNIMPEAEKYEASLLFPLGRSVIQIEPVWIRLATHGYRTTNREHLDSLYVTFEKAVEKKGLDGLIVTGAPVEDIPFEDVKYWTEITGIYSYARENIASTLGLCWGGLSLAGFMGIDKTVYAKKLSGVFESRNICRTHRITGEMDDLFWCPQSRHSGIDDDVLERESAAGRVNLLAYSPEAGYIIFESADERFLVHLGHFEYEADRLVQEYLRDRNNGRTDVGPPANLDLIRPVNRWRAHCLEFFTQWIKFVHENTQCR